MILTHEEEAMLRGDEGEAAKLAMEILTKVGEKFGAKRLVPVGSAHIVLAMYKSIFDAGVEVCEKFAAIGAKFRVPTTLDPSGMDTQKWREFEDARGLCRKAVAGRQGLRADRRHHELDLPAALQRVGAALWRTCRLDRVLGGCLHQLGSGCALQPRDGRD